MTAKRQNWRRVYAKLASAAAQKYLIRVEYGYDTDWQGKRVLFYNEGEYTTLDEARKALSAFIET